MIIVMNNDAKPESIEKVKSRLEESGLGVHLSTGENRTIIGVLGDKRRVAVEAFEAMEDVEKVMHVEAPYKLANKEFHPEPTVINVGEVQIGGNQLVVMAGPCSVESRDQLLETAAFVKEEGAKILRGGAFKPRTSPYSFQGMGEEGLKLLAEAREQTGLKIITEVMDVDNLPMIAEYVDILQIGARNMQNFHLLKAVGRYDLPVMLKRGISATMEEWLMAAEYIMSEGNEEVILCERGIRTFETYTRNTLDLSTIPVIKHLSHLPIIIDPSHGTGKSQYIRPMARAAVAAGADGIMVEVHPDPSKALSDGPQSLNPTEYRVMMKEMTSIADFMGRPL